MSVLSRRRLGAALLGCLLVTTSCGGDSKKTDAKAAPAARSTTTTSPPVPLPVGRVARIVSLSPTATEMLFAIGADNQVVAVDSASNFPAKAPVTDLSAYEPNVEAIAKYRPDLVITDGTNDQLISQLGALGIATFPAKAPKSLSGVLQQIEQIGAATGNIAAASQLSADLQAKIDGIMKAFPKREGSLHYYYELDNTYYSASSKTFIGAILNSLGMKNIADKADNKKSAGYPQLTPEYIVQQNPDVIFLADTKCCQQTLATLTARPGWATIKAVQFQHVITLDDDVASRWGPRIVDLLRQVAGIIATIPPVLDYPDDLTNS